MVIRCDCVSHRKEGKGRAKRARFFFHEHQEANASGQASILQSPVASANNLEIWYDSLDKSGRLPC
jgi:hypothetical protein